MLLQELDVLPVLRVAWEDDLRPFLRCFAERAAFGVDGVRARVFVDVVAVFGLELGPEDGVREADFDADAIGVEEGVVAVAWFVSLIAEGGKGRGLTPYLKGASLGRRCRV
jgi:hypothetical protein